MNRDDSRPASDQPLFSSYRLGGLLLKNRIAMSPMTRQRSPDGVPNALNVEYYQLRSAAGLIFSESTSISPQAVSRRDNPRIYEDVHVEGWRAVTDAVHAGGGKMFLQLMHCGHNSHPSLQPGGQLPIGPSAIPARGTVRIAEGYVPLGTPRAIEAAEIPRIVDEYRQAAIRARQAGFDGVEVHSGNGYLLDQFLRDSTNKRDDLYGGSPENRRRLTLAVVDAVIGVWGRDLVGVRISPVSTSGYEMRDSDPETLFACVVEGLEQRGIGFLHVVEGEIHPGIEPPAFDFARLRRMFSRTYIANQGYDFETANRAVAEGHADIVSFGRPFIANPDLVERFARNAPLNEVDMETLRNSGRSGYLDYPLLEDASESRAE